MIYEDAPMQDYRGGKEIVLDRLLVFGSFVQKAGAVGSSLDVIRDVRALSKVEVVSGVLEDEYAKLLTDFFATKR